MKPMFMAALLIFGAILLFFGKIVSVYAANCIYDGRSYPPGTRIGPYVCQPDGTWKDTSRRN
jgi:hypothetical protein